MSDNDDLLGGDTGGQEYTLGKAEEDRLLADDTEKSVENNVTASKSENNIVQKTNATTVPQRGKSKQVTPRRQLAAGKRKQGTFVMKEEFTIGTPLKDQCEDFSEDVKLDAVSAKDAGNKDKKVSPKKFGVRNKVHKKRSMIGENRHMQRRVQNFPPNRPPFRPSGAMGFEVGNGEFRQRGPPGPPMLGPGPPPFPMNGPPGIMRGPPRMGGPPRPVPPPMLGPLPRSVMPPIGLMPRPLPHPRPVPPPMGGPHMRPMPGPMRGGGPPNPRLYGPGPPPFHDRPPFPMMRPPFSHGPPGGHFRSGGPNVRSQRPAKQKQTDTQIAEAAAKKVASKWRRRIIKPWVDDTMVALMRERDIQFRKWKSCPNNLEYKKSYSKARNRINKMISVAKASYLEEL